MFTLAPWFYRDLLGENKLIEAPDNYQITLLNGECVFESNVKLKEAFRPSWLSVSKLYKNCDGSGTSKYQNIAVYKAISESLERMAFYELVDSNPRDYCFDFNPTTTGMAAYPSLTAHYARENARLEAVERYSIHEFNRNNVPVKVHNTKIPNLSHYELLTQFQSVNVSVLVYFINNYYIYGFAAGKNLNSSFKKAIIELDRNRRVLDRLSKLSSSQLEANVDKTLNYFSTVNGHNKFLELISKSPNKFLRSSPKVLCDKELIGVWSKYTKVWRFLLEDSYFNCSTDETFFMF